MTLVLAGTWEIPSSALHIKAVCSSGPGGQNVNKVSTKVQLRFSMSDTDALSEGQKSRFKTTYPSYVTGSGEVLIVCDETRSQETNKEMALARLRSMILAVRYPPRPRRATKPSRSQKERRLSDKKARSVVKKNRRTSIDQ